MAYGTYDLRATRTPAMRPTNDNWLYPCGRNWQVPAAGHYRLCVRIETAEVHRHCRPSHPRQGPVAVEFSEVAIEPG